MKCLKISPPTTKCVNKFLESGASGQHHEHDANETKDQSSRTDDQLQALIDPLMGMMDYNRDGYISWEEYRESEKTAKNN